MSKKRYSLVRIDHTKSDEFCSIFTSVLIEPDTFVIGQKSMTYLTNEYYIDFHNEEQFATTIGGYTLLFEKSEYEKTVKRYALSYVISDAFAPNQEMSEVIPWLKAALTESITDLGEVDIDDPYIKELEEVAEIIRNNVVGAFDDVGGLVYHYSNPELTSLIEKRGFTVNETYKGSDTIIYTRDNIRVITFDTAGFVHLWDEEGMVIEESIEL
jgi:hypothetical protein